MEIKFKYIFKEECKYGLDCLEVSLLLDDEILVTTIHQRSDKPAGDQAFDVAKVMKDKYEANLIREKKARRLNYEEMFKAEEQKKIDNRKNSSVQQYLEDLSDLGEEEIEL